MTKDGTGWGRIDDISLLCPFKSGNRNLGKSTYSVNQDLGLEQIFVRHEPRRNV
jgi:hypothetical protein